MSRLSSAFFGGAVYVACRSIDILSLLFKSLDLFLQAVAIELAFVTKLPTRFIRSARQLTKISFFCSCLNEP